MGVASGFSNTWTSGEIFPDAQDRVDIQPIAKGCDTAQNLIIQISGPLKKRRGLWNLGAVQDQSKMSRLIPFRRSIDDALMLLFGDATVSVYQANGSPLLNAGVPVTFASPWSTAQLAGLRYKQVADVIYFTHATGLPPRALERLSDTSWVFNLLTFSNGPWLRENTLKGATLTFTGADQSDTNTGSVPTAGVIRANNAVTIVSSTALFNAGMVGDIIKIRANAGNPSMRSWFAGHALTVGWFVTYNGNVYACTATSGSANEMNMSTPPVQNQPGELQSDGCNTLEYLHDGAGQVQITAVADATHASGMVTSTLPVGSGRATYCYSFPAYAADNGWPRAWPSAVEERLVTGATTNSLDQLDMTWTAGFTPTDLNYHPGTGTGVVLDTDAVRRRVGDDGAEILWTAHATFVIVGTASGEHIASGGLFGEPITPSSIVVRQISGFGSEDVYPAKVEKGLCFVTRGGHALRHIEVDLQQNVQGTDLSFLAQHISSRSIVQMAWLPHPDNVLYLRLGDGGFAAMTMHDEQEVRGFTQQAFSADWVVEDVVTLPGPSRLETLWMIVSRVKAGATQRLILMQSQVSDAMFMDVAQFYSGAPATVIGGLGVFEGETVRILADGVQVTDQVVTGGTITLATAAKLVQVGQPLPVFFKTLKLNMAAAVEAGTIGNRQKLAGAVVDVLTAQCVVGVSGSSLTETIRSRVGLATGAVRINHDVTTGGGDERDPRLTISEDSAYDFGVFAIKPRITSGTS